MVTLALAYLRDRSLTTALNILLLGLAVMTLVLLLLFSTQLSNRLDRDAQGIDLVVGAKGSPLQLILSSIYHIDQPTGNIPLDSVELLRNNHAVERVVPLALGDNFRGYRIVGTEPAYLDLHSAALAQGRMNGAPMEALLGADVARVTGAQIGQRFVGTHGLSAEEGAGDHDHAPFETVGILAPTGTVVDRLILTSVESVWDVHGIDHDHEGEAGHDHAAGHAPDRDHDHDHDQGHDHAAQATTIEAATTEPAAVSRPQLEPEVTALLVSYRSAFGAVSVPGFINRQTNMQAAVPAVETARLLTLFGAGINGARLFAWLLAATGGLAIFVALLNAAAARQGDLALLRVMGASRASVFGTILLEGLITAAAGTAIGIVAGHALVAIAVGNFRPLAELGLDPWAFHPGEIAIAVGVLAIGAIAALIPALRVFRIDLARALAQAQ